MRGVKRQIEVSKVVTLINVRHHLRQERVIYLTNILKNGGSFDLIEVRWDGEKERFELVRGRHRFAAYLAAGFEIIDALAIKCSAKKAAILAVSENADPTHLPYDDNEIPLNINVLLEAGYYKPEIRRTFQHIPGTLMTKYFTRASTILYKRKLRKAVECCEQNEKMNVELVAKRFGVKVSSLTKALEGEAKPPGLPELKGRITTGFGQLQNRTTSTSARLRKCFHDGQITESQLLDLSNHIQDRLKSLSLALTEEHGRNERLSVR